MKLTPHNQSKALSKIQSFYDSRYYKDAKPLTVKPSFHLYRLAEKIGVKKNMVILDVACGLGEWLLACKSTGAKIYGIDLSKKAIETCKVTFNDAEFHASPAESLPFQKGQFDIITCLGSLEHFIDPSLALQEMIRVAKPDARLLLLVPNKNFLTRKLRLFAGTQQIDAKEEVKTLEEWDELFEQSGLTVIDKWKDLHILSWDWIKLSKWYLIPLRTLQAIALLFWPLEWQYQVYHLCKIK